MSTKKGCRGSIILELTVCIRGSSNINLLQGTLYIFSNSLASIIYVICFLNSCHPITQSFRCNGKQRHIIPTFCFCNRNLRLLTQLLWYAFVLDETLSLAEEEVSIFKSCLLSPPPHSSTGLIIPCNLFHFIDTNYHIGNNSFRHLVESYQDRYWAATNRKDKSQMIAAIIHTWRSQKPAGRFLAKTDPTKGDDSLWHDVGDQV